MRRFTFHSVALIMMLPFLFLTCHKGSSLSKNVPTGRPAIVGQVAPLDMVFIPGAGAMPSFYMGVSEEPNINYLIYLNWTKNVFGESYPEIYEKAKPKRHLPTRLVKYNDPYIEAYMTHPAFSYYPVTGLSWIQIQEYLQWKTDRLNEAILIELGIINRNSEQRDEDNFNTEAYLYEQYQGSVRKNLPDEETGGERTVRFEDGILFSGFRLPTEAEWEHASQAKFKKPIDRKKCLDPFSKAAINHPYGKNYYTLNWYDFDEIPAEELYRNDESGKEQASRAFTYTPDEHDRNGTPQRLMSIGDFEIKEYGLANMESNVREWLMDFYAEEFDAATKDPLVIMERSGFKTQNAVSLGEDGRMVEKNRLGRMRDFRILGIQKNGTALQVGNYHAAVEEKQDLKKELLARIEAIKKRLDDIAVQPTYYEERKTRMEARLEVLEYLLGDEKTAEEKQVILNDPSYVELKRSSEYQWKYEAEKLSTEIEDVKPDKLKKNLGMAYMAWADIENYLADTAPKKRLVKGGTWENPGKQRMALEEVASDIEVGFRCVLPYTALPVANKWKVKWRK